jgi:NADPH:quinone reductase-like Zn-dependent oxidoreductase
VNQFQVGDEVFGCSNQKGGGGYQEYYVVPEDSGFIKKPAVVSHEQAGSFSVLVQSPLFFAFEPRKSEPLRYTKILNHHKCDIAEK